MLDRKQAAVSVQRRALDVAVAEAVDARHPALDPCGGASVPVQVNHLACGKGRVLRLRSLRAGSTVAGGQVDRAIHRLDDARAEVTPAGIAFGCKDRSEVVDPGAVL